MIAAVNGIAMGGGFEIALACDIIVAAENAIFALPEPRVGLAALAGGMFWLCGWWFSRFQYLPKEDAE